MDNFPQFIGSLYNGVDSLLTNAPKPNTSSVVKGPPRKGTEEHKKNSAETERLSYKYPDRIPVIVITCDDLVIDKTKFLVPNSLTFGQLMYTIRKRLDMTDPRQLGSQEALYGLVDRCMVPTSQLIAQNYQKSKHTDGMLYVYVYRENTFG